MRRLLLTLSTVLVAGSISACKSNPYDGKPAVTIKPQSSPTPTPVPTATPKPTPTPTPAPTFSLDAPDVMKFVVGTKGEYIVRGTVAPPGVAQITFKNLPSGASYDATTQKLSWTPGSGDVGTIVVTIRLQSSADPVSGIQKDSVLVVSASKPLSTRIATRMTNSGNNGAVEFEMVAADMTMSEFPQWSVQAGANVNFSTSELSDGYFPRTMIRVVWTPVAGEKQLTLSACANSWCSERGVRVDNGVVLQDLSSGAVINFGGER